MAPSIQLRAITTQFLVLRINSGIPGHNSWHSDSASIPCITHGMEAGQTISKLSIPCVSRGHDGSSSRRRCTPIYIGPGGGRQLEPKVPQQRAAYHHKPCQGDMKQAIPKGAHSSCTDLVPPAGGMEAGAVAAITPRWLGPARMSPPPFFHEHKKDRLVLHR